MATEMKNAQELLFGAAGLNVSNFKLFPGSDREVTAEQIAAQLNNWLLEPVAASDTP
jgi:hypothetical protein